MQASRVDHVGSLLRPGYLKDAFQRFARRDISREDLGAVQDRAIRDVVARQESLGLPVITDGEFRRLNWQVSFSEVEGWDMWRTSWDNFRRHPGNRSPGETPLTRGEDAVLSFRTPVTARLSLKKNFPLSEFEFIKSPRTKVTLMGPDRVAQMSEIKGSPYRSRDEFLADVVRIQRRIVEELARAGGFEPLRFVPKGVTVVLGLITTKTGTIEATTELIRRIEEAARFLPLEQLALSPQCGFASGIAGNLLTEGEQWRKLEVMMDVARQVWQ